MTYALALAMLLAGVLGVVVYVIGAWHRVHQIDIYGNAPSTTAWRLQCGWTKGRCGLVPILIPPAGEHPALIARREAIRNGSYWPAR